MYLGPFELHSILGKGGMGVVWRATHRRQNVPVAVKILTEDYARSHEFVEALENEARAAASMQHSAIAVLYDYGTVDRDAAQSSQGKLVEGSPYLAIEMASDGSLEKYTGPFSWPFLKSVLLTLLDALAHAHARGLVHRDLKPGNVLICGENDFRPGLKLTDFGIAHMSDSTPRKGTMDHYIQGTPLYMAPEQIGGYFRDYGAWTDLYALGCMAYHFATGHAPFVGKTVYDCMQQHLNSALPSLGEYTQHLPEGFYNWLERMCAKSIQDRFQFAADAAWELLQLPEVKGTSGISHSHVLHEGADAPGDDSFALEETLTRSASQLKTIQTLWFSPNVSDDDETSVLRVSASIFDEKPPPDKINDTEELRIPDSPVMRGKPFPAWQYEAMDSHDSPKMIGVGLGLYGLRPIPMTGRHEERDRIWSALEAVHTNHRAELVLLQGPSGSGKSRLAEWVCERAHELGVASVMHVSHSPQHGQFSGLQRMVASFLNCEGLEQHDIQARIEQHLELYGAHDTYELNALLSLLPDMSSSGSFRNPDSEVHQSRQPAQTLQFSTPNEIWALVTRFIKRIASSRPVIMWMDDVHWESSSVGFLRYVLEIQAYSPFPILLLATTREEDLAELPYADKQLQEVLALPNTNQLYIGPLSSMEQIKFIRSTLGLSDALALELEARTAGNPLFCVQLIGDWIERGILEVGNDGFQLKDDAEVVLPDEIYDVWSHRIESLLEHHSDSDGHALELAAVLGYDIQRHEWDRLCQLAQVCVSDELITILLQKRLIRGTRQHWTWSHGMLRETMARRSRERHRWQHAHELAARLLQSIYPTNYRGLSARLGLHFLEAHQPEAAFDNLLKGARQVAKRSEYEHALYLLTRCREALQQMQAPVSDSRRGSVEIAYVEFSSQIRPRAEMLQAALEIKSTAEQFQWDEVQAEALICLALIHQPDHDRIEETESYFLQARNAYEQLGDKQGVADCMRGLGWCATDRAHYKKATLFFEIAIPIYTELGDSRNIATCMRGLGMIARKSGHLQQAESWFQRAYKTYEDYGSTNGIMWCIHDLAEIARESGKLEEAERGYTRTIQLMTSLGVNDTIFPRFNLGLVQIARENYATARVTFSTLLKDFEKQQRTVYQGIAHICLLPCVANAKEWAEFDIHLEAGIKNLHHGNYVDPDIAEAAELAGQICHKNVQLARARKAYTFAYEHWMLLDNRERAAKIAQLLESFTGE